MYETIKNRVRTTFFVDFISENRIAVSTHIILLRGNYLVYHDKLFDRTECVAFTFVNRVGSFVQQREYIIRCYCNFSFINTNNIRRSFGGEKKIPREKRIR